ncbi:MAG: CIA30 family protein, partial [Bradymonadia bacterium]
QGFKTNGKWQTMIFPVSDLLPRWRGRQLDGMPPLLSQDVTGVGFIIADKRSGPFILEVRSIEGFTPLN